jgi:hypothetical protein
VEGLDFREIFTPIARHEAIRIDVKSAFLNDLIQ